MSKKASFSEMSTDKMRDYVHKAREDFKQKIKSGDTIKSIKRAKSVQAAEIKVLNREDAAVNNVGSGNVAGAGVGSSGEPGVSKKKNPKLLKDIVSRKPT